MWSSRESRKIAANCAETPHMRRRASRVVRSDGIACRRCRDQPRGLCGTSPHHLISGRLARSLHPSPACTGQSARLEEDGTHLYDGIKALGIPGPHPSRFAASDGGRFASNSGLSLDHGPLRHQALRQVPPQGDHQLACQSNDLVRRIRPLLAPTRSWNQQARLLSGWCRSHSQASSMAVWRARGLPDLWMP